MRQVRSQARKQAKIKRHEKAVELQMALEDRAAARSVLLDAAGEPVIISNMGEDWVEIGAAWQVMEDASTRANAKIQLLAIAPFDSDMSEAEMIAALGHFCRTTLDPLGLPYSAAIHAPPAQGEQRNFHPHIAFSLRPMRRVEPYAWEVADEVCGELDGRDGVQMLRHLWAHSMSAAAEQARSNRRYTGLGYGARRLDLEAGEHLGEQRAAIVARGGHVWAHERNRIKAARNAARRAIRDADNKIAALTKVRDAAVKQIERRVDTVVPAKIIRAAPPVEVATLLTRARVPASATVLTASALTMPANAIVRARTYVPSRPAVAAAVAPIEATVTTTSPAVTPAMIRTTAVTPLRPVTRWSATRPVVAGDRRQTSFAAKHAVTYEPAGRAHPAALPLVPAVAPIGGRTLSGARQVSPRVILAPIGSTTTLQRDDPVAPLLDALAIARSARIRKRRNGTGADGLRLDTLPTLGAVVMLDAVPSLDQLAAEATSRLRVDAERLGDDDLVRVARLTALDPYVADYSGDNGQVETDYPALKAIGVGWDWLQAPGVQQALRAMRDEQQMVVADLAREARARPLAFAKTGSRFWPRDLPADHLRRIDRWANDPGFERDASEMQRTIDRAHAARDAEHRRARVGNEQVGAKALPRISDGFGGWRQGPAPVFHDDGIRARIAAFDTGTGKPTEQLLMLLMLAGQHPRRIHIAADGRLIALPGKPAMLAALLHPWRHDDRVAVLVTETVRASREAGSSVWPQPIAGAVQAYAARAAGPSGLATRRPPPDLGRGPAR